MKAVTGLGNNLLRGGFWLFAPILLASSIISQGPALSAPAQAPRHKVGQRGVASLVPPQTGVLLFNPPYEFVDRKIAVDLAKLEADVEKGVQAYQQSLASTHHAIARAKAVSADRSQWLAARRMSWQTVEVGRTLCSALDRKVEYIRRVQDTAPAADRDYLLVLVQNDISQCGGVMRGLADILSLLSETRSD